MGLASFNRARELAKDKKPKVEETEKPKGDEDGKSTKRTPKQ